jgi:hypothetical protein
MKVSDFVGKALFPYSYQWEQRRNARIIFFSLPIVILLTCLIGWAFVHGAVGKNKTNPEPQVNFHSAS